MPHLGKARLPPIWRQGGADACTYVPANRIYGYSQPVTTFLIKESADLLGVSDDTLRRWADGGRIETTTDDSGRQAIDGATLARFAEELDNEAAHQHTMYLAAA